MIPKRQRNNSTFFMKIRNQGSFLKMAGTSDKGEGETKPAAETTRRLSEAQGFQTRRQAGRMQKLLITCYGVKADIIIYEGVRRYDA